MTAVAFDTLKFVKKLRDAGIPEEQAEAQAEAFAEAVDVNLATKQDIKDVRRDIKDAVNYLIIAISGLVVVIPAVLKLFDYLF